MSTNPVLITGAAGGIGRATVRRLAEGGWPVFAGVRRPEDARAFDGIAAVTPIVIDVLDEASVRAASVEIDRRLGDTQLHAIVNNAGIIVQGPVELVPAAELERQFAVNVYGPMSVVRVFGPRIRADKARVVNVSAPTARRAVPHLGPISASKAALESLSAALRVELAPWGVDVVIVEPTAASTPVFSKADAAADAAQDGLPEALVGSYREQLDAVAAASARQRLADPESVAKVLVTAITAPRPRTVYYAGSGAKLLPTLAKLPDRLGDRVIAGSFGLSARVAR
jgi:NAD(P)-dependent dehydrogenase (short-subunit alcohol dehydrogenase family)